MNVASVPFLKRFFARLRIGARPTVPEGTGDVHWDANTDKLSLANSTGTAWKEFTLGASGGVENGGTGFTSYAKGDLLVGNSSTTLSKLPAGATGKALFADSSEALGLKYGTLPAAGGGTGHSSYTIGDLLVGDSAGGLSRLTVTSVPVGYVLRRAPSGIAWQALGAGAPDDAPYIVDSNTPIAGLTDERLIGDVINRGTHASRPVSATVGRLHFTTDSGTIARFSPSGFWENWGLIYRLNAPPTTGWSWLNQKTATVDETRGRIVLRAEMFNTTNAFMVTARLRAAASPPVTYIIAFRGVFENFELSDDSWGGFSFVFRNSSTNEVQTYTPGKKALTITPKALIEPSVFPRIYNADSADTDTFTNTEYLRLENLSENNLIFMRLYDDGTDVDWDISLDGAYWIPVASGVARLTGYDQVGFGIISRRQSATALRRGVMWLHHWEVAV